MIYLIIIFVLWTWGLTPVWVNIVCTVLAGLGFLDALDKTDTGDE